MHTPDRIRDHCTETGWWNRVERGAAPFVAEESLMPSFEDQAVFWGKEHTAGLRRLVPGLWVPPEYCTQGLSGRETKQSLQAKRLAGDVWHEISGLLPQDLRAAQACPSIVTSSRDFVATMSNGGIESQTLQGDG